MKVLNKLELMNPNVKIGGENGYIVELPSESGCVLTQAATETKIATAKTEAIDVAKQYTDSAVTSVYRVKGVVASVEDLPENAEIGDVYNIGDDLDGHNYVKTESGWDKLGGTVNLEPYALKVQVESDISTAKSEAIAAAASETQTQISALNISQYAKTDDVYTKTAADSTFVKIGEQASKVEAVNIYACGITTGALTVVNDLTVCAPTIFNNSVEFNCIPTINGTCVATLDDLEFLPASISCTSGNGCYFIPASSVDFDGTVTIGGSKVATLKDLEFLPATVNIVPGACGTGIIVGYTVSDEVDFGGTVNFSDDLVVSGQTILNGVACVHDNFAVSGGTYLCGDTNICGNLCVHSDLHVSGNTEFNEVPTVNDVYLATTDYVSGCLNTALSIAKDYTDEEIGKLGSVLEYKGNSTYENLPTENETGDVYNITADYAEKEIKAGDNVVWNGSDWDVLSGPVDLSGYYDKTEVDEKLEGYLPVTTFVEGNVCHFEILTPEGGQSCFWVDGLHVSFGAHFNGEVTGSINHTYFNGDPSCSSNLVTKGYLDKYIGEIEESLACVNTALEGYLPVNGMCGMLGQTGYMIYCAVGFTGFLPITYSDPYNKSGLLTPTDDGHLTNKKYVDDTACTVQKYVDDTVSTANSNIVYDEDIELGDGTFDEINKEMTWTITPTGATKIISLLAVDASGNVVFPSYIWKDKVLTVKIYAESELDNPGYTVTVSYKK